MYSKSHRWFQDHISLVNSKCGSPHIVYPLSLTTQVYIDVCNVMLNEWPGLGKRSGTINRYTISRYCYTCSYLRTWSDVMWCCQTSGIAKVYDCLILCFAQSYIQLWCVHRGTVTPETWLGVAFMYVGISELRFLFRGCSAVARWWVFENAGGCAKDIRIASARSSTAVRRWPHHDIQCGVQYMAVLFGRILYVRSVVGGIGYVKSCCIFFFLRSEQVYIAAYLPLIHHHQLLLISFVSQSTIDGNNAIQNVSQSKVCPRWPWTRLLDSVTLH